MLSNGRSKAPLASSACIAIAICWPRRRQARRIGWRALQEHISQSFRALVAKYNAVNGVSVADRGVFIMGLYDGMMNDLRDVGQRLPSRPGLGRRRGRVKRPAVSPAMGLHLHPYSLALGLGRQVRFSVPLQDITAELDSLTQPRLTNEAAPSDRQSRGKNSRASKVHSALAG